ncbi:MAG: 4Fe-4S dicluster domain-containing protein [Planctomycetes bacterium]|nr:4Fe-4S dicluster domain-containing protein [Planctomycetota bacterium]
MSAPDAPPAHATHAARPLSDALLDPSCVHCGFCLPACPTYSVLQTEMDSPRGRLQLIEGLGTGRIEPTPQVVAHLDACLLCRACETACPSGVAFGERMEDARAAWHDAPRPLGRRLVERMLTRVVAAPPFVQRMLLGVGARLLALGDGLAAPFPLPARVRTAFALARQFDPRREPELVEGFVAMPRGRARLRVGLLLGCVQRHLFDDVNAATARLLVRAGCEVVIVRGQGCCGALASHAGQRESARSLARKLVAACDAAGPLDRIVSNAAGCGAALHGYPHLLPDDAEAADFAARTVDALELLDELGLPPARRAVPRRAVYHDACHHAHAQGLRAAPRRLLEAIPGLELLPLPDSERCCGSAGIYNLLEPRTADALLDDKLSRLHATGADTVLAANPGCLLHLRAGLLRARLPIEALHPLLLLDAAHRVLLDDEGEALLDADHAEDASA